MAPSSPSTFCSLPREIRDQILTAVLESELSPPTYSADYLQDRMHVQEIKAADREYGEENVHYHTRPVLISGSSLLLTNHQVCAETRNVIYRLEDSQMLRYKLDCIIESEKAMYPTWLKVPALSRWIGTIDVDFRIVGVRDEHRTNFFPGDGGPEQASWDSLALLNRFMERGPDFISPGKGGRKKIQVGTVAITVVPLRNRRRDLSQ
ncbi:MAG: hypothetical protein M1833_001091 [Piccolia ochrophora]|nr:MAG: hypothetical protein M1833_001091 [Piccolia ochrophora]